MCLLREKTCLLFLVIFLVHGEENYIINDHSIELTQSLNLGRQELIQEVCNRFPPSVTFEQLATNGLDHILVDDKHKLLYCYVPKVACTNWKRVLMILGEKWNDTDVLSIPAYLAHTPGMFQKLTAYPVPERQIMLENYQKMIIVRNPFERLLSAYRNKLEGKSKSAKYFQNRVGRRIIKAFRVNPSNESLDLGHDVTFREFAQFLTSKHGGLADVVHNEHWAPITSLCHPCLVNYTLVGKYETLIDDTLLALHTINASYIQFPRLVQTSGTNEKLRHYFSQLDLLLIKKMYKMYQMDFRLFDYDLGDVIGFDLG